MASDLKNVTRKQDGKRSRSNVAPAVEVKLAAATDDSFFEVEAVIGRRFHRGGVEYLIRWKGFSEEHSTWEPAANLSDAALEEAERFTKRQRPEESNFDSNENGHSGNVAMLSARDTIIVDDKSIKKKVPRITDDGSGGHRLSPYEQARLDRIKRNEERLASLGLFDVKKKLGSAVRRTGGGGQRTTTPNKRRPSRACASAVTPSPTRSSRRLKLEPERYEPTMDDDVAILFKKVKQKTKKTTRSNSFKCDIPMDISTSPLTEDERAVLETKMGGDFLGKFEDYLTQVDTISDQNRRNVLRQITKLASGEGIRYESHAYGWPEGCYFLEGVKVGPADDILKLMDIGRECEEKWGKDHGNGWLLSHPLKKLYMFQQYHLQQV